MVEVLSVDTKEKGKKQNSKRDTLIRGEINKQLLCSSNCIWSIGSDATTLTLRSHGVRDWTGVTEAVGVHCSDHKQVDSSRLQVPQDKGLGLYMFSQGDPSAAQCITAGERKQETHTSKTGYIKKINK